MASRAASTLLTKANGIKTKLQSALKPISLEIKHAFHPPPPAAAADESAGETHYFVKIESQEFLDQSSDKRVQMVHSALGDELKGLDALYVCPLTALEAEAEADYVSVYHPVAAPRNAAAFHPLAASGK